MSTPQERGAEFDIGYDDFAEQLFYRRVNASLLRLAPNIDTAVDLATGTGAAVKILFELERIIPGKGSSIYGFDIDSVGLQVARKKVNSINTIGVNTLFAEGSFDQIALPGSSQKFASLLNGPHLANELLPMYKEMRRVLVDEGLEATIDDISPRDAFLSKFHLPNEGLVPFPDFQLEESFFDSESGIAFLNSAYVKNKAYPEGTGVVWKDIILAARKKLRRELGVLKFERPVDRFKYTQEEYVEHAKTAGFSFVQTFDYTAEMDVQAMQAICKYAEFAKGALPGIPVLQAAKSLYDAVPEVYEKYGIESVPRTWMFLVLRK